MAVTLGVKNLIMKARASIQRNILHTYPQHSALNFKGWQDLWKPICECPRVPGSKFSFFISIKRDINFAFLQELRGSLMNIKIHISQVM